jgi:hypothetical protein
MAPIAAKRNRARPVRPLRNEKGVRHGGQTPSRGRSTPIVSRIGRGGDGRKATIDRCDKFHARPTPSAHQPRAIPPAIRGLSRPFAPSDLDAGRPDGQRETGTRCDLRATSGLRPRAV